MRRLLLLLVMSPLLAGCASVCPPERADRVRLTEENLEVLSGTYELVGESIQCPNCTPTLLGELEDFGRQLSNHEPGVQSTIGDSARVLTLRVREDQSIVAVAHRQDEPAEIRLFSGKVNGDGYFALDGYFGIKGAPFPLLWAPTGRDAQFGADAEGRLLVDWGTSGFGFFLALPVLGSSYCESFVFERVEREKIN